MKNSIHDSHSSAARLCLLSAMHWQRALAEGAGITSPRARRDAATLTAAWRANLAAGCTPPHA